MGNTLQGKVSKHGGSSHPNRANTVPGPAKCSGWIMWTWKAENADERSYQAGLAKVEVLQLDSEQPYL